VIYSDPSWDAAKFTTADARASESLNPSNIKTYPSQLDSFRSNGGKIIMYHGLQDQQITSLISSQWYNHFVSTSNTNSQDIDKFLRYFPISGMFHCQSGPGAWMIGQADQPIPFERSRNVLAAIVDWVEHGVAPDTIEGTKYTGDTVSSGRAFTRKHCR
jgi:feruloyl esterase